MFITCISCKELIVVKALYSKDKSVLCSTCILCCLCRFLVLQKLWLVNNSQYESDPVKLWIHSHVLRLLL